MPHTILVADDSVTIRRVVELAFQDSDVRVEAVGSGAEAMDRLAVSRPDLVLADVILPTPSGYDLCRAVKHSDRPVPVLLLRGAFEPFDERRAIACGADGTVTKPFEPGRLVERVRALLDRPAAAASDPDETPSAAEAEAALRELLEAPTAPRFAPAVAAAPETPAAVPGAGIAEDAREVPVRVGRAEPDAAVGRPAAPLAIPVEVIDDDRGTPVEVEPPAPEAPPDRPAAGGTALDAALVEAVADEVVRRLSDRVVREIAWEVVPDLAAALIRERLREIEREDPELP